MQAERQRLIRALFDEYIEMYAARDDRLTTRFSDNFSGYTGGGDFLVKDKAQWVKITRQDFAQVPERIRQRMHAAGNDGQRCGIELGRELLDECRALANGVYLMPSFGRFENCLQVLDGAR